MKSDAHDDARVYSAQALGRIADPAAFGPLLAAMKEKDSRVREAAAQSLGLLGDTTDFRFDTVIARVGTSAPRRHHA